MCVSSMLYALVSLLAIKSSVCKGWNDTKCTLSSVYFSYELLQVFECNKKIILLCRVPILFLSRSTLLAPFFVFFSVVSREISSFLRGVDDKFVSKEK